jgi:hypothetical protein
VKQNKYWLEIRGFPFAGNAKVLKERVQKYLSMETPPPILPITSVDKHQIFEMVTSLQQMISFLMSPDTNYNDISKIEIMIRKFLIHYDKVDTAMGKKDQPSWCTQYNFLCLLNLPSVMRKFGNIRNIWEGGVEGEVFLRKYKKELRTGLMPNWQMWTIKNLLQRGVFNKENIDTPQNWKDTLTLECRIYQSRSVLTNIINSGKPISGIRNVNKTETETKSDLYILHWKNKMILGQQIYLNWKTCEEFNEKYYYEIVVGDDVIPFDNKIGTETIGILLLPRIAQIKDNTMYCIVTSDWKLT